MQRDRAAQIQRDRHDTHRSAPPVASRPSRKIPAARGPWRGQHTYLRAEIMRARAAQPRTTRHAGKVNARALKAKGHGGPNTTGYARHSPLHAARRVEAEWEDSSCPGALAGPRVVRKAMQEDTCRTLHCKARLAHSCARMFGKLGKPRLALKAP